MAFHMTALFTRGCDVARPASRPEAGALAPVKVPARPAGLRFAIAQSVGQLNGQQWDEAVRGQPWFFSRDYLGVLESASPACLAPRYGLISDDRGPVASVVMQWACVERDRLRAPAKASKHEPGSRLTRIAAKVAADLGPDLACRLASRVLVCGNLLSHGMHAVAMRADAEPRAVWKVVDELLHHVNRAEGGPDSAGLFVVKDLTDADSPSGAALAGLTYVAANTEPNMVLALEPGWQTYGDYLQSLNAKYRNAVRHRVLDPIRAAGLCVRRFQPTAALQPRMHDLYLQVLQNAAFRPFTLHPDYFCSLSAAAGSRVRFSGIFAPDDQLLAFAVTLIDGSHATSCHVGFDRAAAARCPLYLQLLHATIADAIEAGASDLSLGRTALEAKSGLGARPVGMSIWMKHRHPVISRMARRIVARVPHEDFPVRNPFKAA